MICPKKEMVTLNGQWCCGVVVITTVQLQLSLNSDSAQVQTLLMACQRFTMVRISDNGPNWK